MKIISYNLNGIRSAASKGFFEWLESELPDVLLVQETKAQPDQIDLLSFERLGYYSYIHSAKKSGYSGVAIFSRVKPDKVIAGIGIEKYDNEGRLLRADFGDTTVINSYFPSGTTGDERQNLKMEWLADFTEYIQQLLPSRPRILIGGDLNIAHKPIDINHPERHTKMSGFLPEEREWFSRFLETGFHDSFRMFHAGPEQYSWWSYRAGSRQKNLGWRIDYHLISDALKPLLMNASILQNIVHSDHCPVLAEIKTKE